MRASQDTEEDDDIWEDISFIKRGKNRVKVLKAFNAPETPPSVSEKTDIRLNIASRAIRELSERDIPECKTPDKKVGRVYVTTEKGDKILNKLDF